MSSPADRERLRRLAAEYAEIVNGDEMNARRERWRLSNRLEARTVPFQIEDNGTFFSDLTPPLECEGEFERSCEAQMLQAVTNFRLIDDDRVFPRTFMVHVAAWRTPNCPDLQYRRVQDSRGLELGFETNTPLADLANSMHKLVPSEYRLDREGTQQRADMAMELFGDILPVETVCFKAAYPGGAVAQAGVLLIGMDDFYLAMLDQPENVHAFFDFLTSEAERYLDWLEEEGLITSNSRETDCGSGSCVYSDELPRREIGPGEKLHVSDIWGFVEAQEAAGISPDMYAEFIHPYQRRIGDRYGLINYGCCEPTHHFWPSLRNFRSIRKVTVSPWCDVASIAEQAGESVVLSRKPHPMKLCGPTFDAREFERDLNETMALTRDNFVELIFRDTVPLCGAMKERVAEACEILHRVTGH